MDEAKMLASKLAYDISLDSNEKKNGLLILISEHNT